MCHQVLGAAASLGAAPFSRQPAGSDWLRHHLAARSHQHRHGRSPDHLRSPGGSGTGRTTRPRGASETLPKPTVPPPPLPRLLGEQRTRVARVSPPSHRLPRLRGGHGSPRPVPGTGAGSGRLCVGQPGPAPLRLPPGKPQPGLCLPLRRLGQGQAAGSSAARR